MKLLVLEINKFYIDGQLSKTFVFLLKRETGWVLIVSQILNKILSIYGEIKRNEVV